MNKTSAEEQRREFDPHAETMTRRDWTFLGYLLALAVIPLIIILIALANLLRNNPDFDNFPKGKPGPERELPVENIQD